MSGKKANVEKLIVRADGKTGVSPRQAHSDLRLVQAEMEQIANTEERKANVQRLRAAEEVVERTLLIENDLNALAGRVIWERDLNMRSTYVSENVESILGYSADIWTRYPDFWMSIVHPSDRELVKNRCASSVLDEKLQQCEFRCVTANGDVLWMRERAILRYDSLGRAGRPIGMLGYWGDITAFKNLEQKLRESQSRYRIAADLTKNAIWEWDLSTNELLWSEGISSLFLYPSSEMKTDIHSWYEKIHPDDRERVVSGIHTAIDRGSPNWQDSYRFRAADGVYRHVEDRATLIQGPGGSYVRMIGTMSDVTAQKKSEKELERLLKVEKQSSAQLEHALKTRDELLKSVTHDLKNPLSNVLMNVALLKRFSPGLSTSPKLMQSFERVQNSAERMRVLIDDIVHIATAESGTLQLKWEDIDWASFIRELEPVAKDEARRSEIDLRFEDVPGEIRVEGDRNFLARGILGLIRFIARQGSKPATLVFKQHLLEDSQVIELKNVNWKLSQETLQKLFAHSQRDLDLSLAKALIRAHGGRIWARTLGDQGTTVSFSLPAKSSAQRKVLIAS